MTERPRQRLEANREKIENSDQLSERDRELLLEFDRQLALQQYSDARHLKLIRHCRVIAGHVETSVGPDETPDTDIAAIIEDRDAAEEYIAWINRQYDNEETNRDMRVALRVFGKLVTEGEEVPDSLSWVPSTTSRSYNPTPDPAEMLSWDNVQTLMDNCYNTRDRALLAVAWDAGPRGGELHGLRVGDVSDHEHGLQISVDGKQGQRSITLFVASSHLSQWLNAHPAGGDDTAPLWCKLSDGRSRVSYQRLGDIPQDAADRADISKPVTFTNFRKSSASHLASQGVSQSILEDHHGWSRGSDVAGRYVSVFSDASDREIAAAHGLDITTEEDDQTIASVECPRCGKRTPGTRSFCHNCHAAIDPEASDLVDDLLGLLDEKLVDADDADERERIIAARRGVRDHSGRMGTEELQELLTSID
jgi:site-specific recombinase XerD